MTVLSQAKHAWEQLGGGHGGRVPPLFQTMGI